MSILFLILFLIYLYNSISIYFENLKYKILASIFVISFFIIILIKLIPVIRDPGRIIYEVFNGSIKLVSINIITDQMYYSSIFFLFIIFIIFITFLIRSFSEDHKKNLIKENIIYLLGITFLVIISTILTVQPILIPDFFNYHTYLIIFIPLYNFLILFFKYFNKEKFLIIFSVLAFYPTFIFTFPLLLSNLLSGKGYCYYPICSLTLYGAIESLIIVEGIFAFIAFVYPLSWLALYLILRKRFPFLIMIFILNLLLILHYTLPYPHYIAYYDYISVDTKPIQEFLSFFNVSIIILILINLIIPLLGIIYKRKISLLKFT
jgi:hypothetical protein